MFADRFRGRSVWLSGHTGFKGAWLAEWLMELGASVHGFALPPSTDPALFNQLDLGRRVHHEIGDVRDAAAVAASIQRAQPDFVFHLAAQALVRASYEAPVKTYAVNVMGTVHVLEALRALGRPCSAVFVTSDKCYENREWVHGYHEDDPLGGHDPYSSSKAGAELTVAAYRRSFFRDHPVRVASARAGNVVGGGDWARDRIMPDCIRALQQGLPILVRRKTAVRPWQHVLEPLSGYLWLAAVLNRPSLVKAPVTHLTSAFNFGPRQDANRTVADLAAEVLKHWPGSWEERRDPAAVHEAGLLCLAIDKAQAVLGWSPVWDFSDAIEHTVNWYREPVHNRELARTHIARYAARAREVGQPWAIM